MLISLWHWERANEGGLVGVNQQDNRTALNNLFGNPDFYISALSRLYFEALLCTVLTTVTE